MFAESNLRTAVGRMGVLRNRDRAEVSNRRTPTKRKQIYQRWMMMGTKILVIDDDVNICDMLKLYLENDGYEVTALTESAALRCTSRILFCSTL